MSEQEVRDVLKTKGCLYPPELGHHFVGISGKHLSGYCNIDPLLPDVTMVAKMTKQLVQSFTELGVQTVLAPAIGAIPLAHWGAWYLQELTGNQVAGVWADKVKPRGFVVERVGFGKEIAGKKVLILEDMVNQMFSVTELRKLVESLGGTNVGVGALVANRVATAQKIGVPRFVKLCEFSYDAWEPLDCELCRRKVPIVTDPALGHGEDYQELHPEYAGGFVEMI
jgi:orotate phosphoribosyltransferase